MSTQHEIIIITKALDLVLQFSQRNTASFQKALQIQYMSLCFYGEMMRRINKTCKTELLYRAVRVITSTSLLQCRVEGVVQLLKCNRNKILMVKVSIYKIKWHAERFDMMQYKSNSSPKNETNLDFILIQLFMQFYFELSWMTTQLFHPYLTVSHKCYLKH